MGTPHAEGSGASSRMCSLINNWCSHTYRYIYIAQKVIHLLHKIPGIPREMGNLELYSSQFHSFGAVHIHIYRYTGGVYSTRDHKPRCGQLIASSCTYTHGEVCTHTCNRELMLLPTWASGTLDFTFYFWYTHTRRIATCRSCIDFRARDIGRVRDVLGVVMSRVVCAISTCMYVYIFFLVMVCMRAERGVELSYYSFRV